MPFVTQSFVSPVAEFPAAVTASPLAFRA